MISRNDSRVFCPDAWSDAARKQRSSSARSLHHDHGCSPSSRLRFRLFFLPLAVPCRGDVSVGLEGAQAAPAPARQQVGRAFLPTFLPLSPEPGGEFEEGTEQGGAIVVHQIDKTGLLHQAAELDQMTGARPPVVGSIRKCGARIPRRTTALPSATTTARGLIGPPHGFLCSPITRATGHTKRHPAAGRVHFGYRGVGLGQAP